MSAQRRRQRRPSRAKAPQVESAFTKKYAKTVLAPLSRAEVTRATKLALNTVLQDSTIRRERLRTYGPFLRIEKPVQRGGRPARMIWVRLRDRDQGIVHDISIEAGKVVAHAIDEDANPPFSNEERLDARRVLASDPSLGKLLARRDIAIEWFNPHAHDGGRVIGARLVRVKDNRVVDRVTEAAVELDQGILAEGKEHHG